MRARHLGLGISVASSLLIVGGGFVSSPAIAGGWTWRYSAVIGSETYVLLKNDDNKGASTVRSNATVTVYDNDADGLGQRLYWRVKGAASWHTCVNTAGNGTHKTCSVTDGKFIQYQFCEKDGGVNVACAPEDGFQT